MERMGTRLGEHENLALARLNLSGVDPARVLGDGMHQAVAIGEAHCRPRGDLDLSGAGPPVPDRQRFTDKFPLAGIDAGDAGSGVCGRCRGSGLVRSGLGPACSVDGVRARG